MFRKTYEGEELLLVYNLSAEPASVTMDGILVNGQEWGSLAAKAVLLTGEEQVVQEGTSLTLPPYSVAVYQ